MKTILIVVGKTADHNITAAIDDYVGRIRHYIAFELVVLPDLRNNRNMTFDQQKAKEGEMLLREIQPGDVVVLLDEAGKEMTSRGFASWFGHKSGIVARRLVFVIGGPYGFSPDVYAAAAERLSLSRMTFSHQMVRLIFVEQLYRAMDILNGGPYHHD